MGKLLTWPVLRGNGDGTFQAAQSVTAGDVPRFVVAGDVNNDGIPDLATVNSGSADLSVLRGNGDGTFQPQQRFAVRSGVRSVAAADVNADGLLDLVTANSGGFNDVSVLVHQ